MTRNEQLHLVDVDSQETFERNIREYVRFYHDEFPGTINDELHIEYINCDYEHKITRFAYGMTKFMENPGKMMHGGITTALLDVSMGLTCSCLRGDMTPSISCQVNFLRPIYTPQRVVVEVHVSYIGGKLMHASSHAWIEGDESMEVATGTGVYSCPKRVPQIQI